MSCCEPDLRNSLAEVSWFTVDGQRQLCGTPQPLQTATGSYSCALNFIGVGTATSVGVSTLRKLTGVKSETLDMRQYVSPRDQLIQVPKSHPQPHGQLMPLKL